MKFKLSVSILSAFLITACSGKPVRDNVTGNSFSRNIGSGNGVCSATAEEITPLDLEEETHAPTDLSNLLSSGTLKTLSARITYETPTDKPGADNATLSLTAVSVRGGDDVLIFSKSCAKNFTPTLGAQAPIDIIIPISNEEGTLVYNVYTIDYGPQYLTDEFLGRYMILESIASDSDDFVDPFGDDAPTSFEDIINDETSRAFITKTDGEVPDAFEDETLPKNYTVTYFDAENSIRYHLTVLWTPPEAPEDEDSETEDSPVVDVEDPKLVRTQ